MSSGVLRIVLASLLLARGIDVWAQQPPIPSQLDSQFLEAAEKGDARSIQQLLAQGANIETRDIDGRTALSLTASAPQLFANSRAKANALKVLLDKGAEVDTRDDDKFTPLMWAASTFRGDSEMRMLLEKGADVDARDSRDRTALIQTVSKKDWSVLDIKKLKLLLEHGAKTEATDKDGRTALMFASALPMQTGGVTTLEFLPVEVIGALFFHGRFDTIKLLLDKHANIDARDSQGRTALVHAAISGNTHALRLLLERGANLEAKDEHGDTALTLATSAGKHDAVRILQDKKKNR